jgi:hypothetical protein
LNLAEYDDGNHRERQLEVGAAKVRQDLGEDQADQRHQHE